MTTVLSTLCLIMLLASLNLVSCTPTIVDDIPDRCPVALDVAVGQRWEGFNTATQWSSDSTHLLFWSPTTSHHSAKWYLASLETASVEPFYANDRRRYLPGWALLSPVENLLIFIDRQWESNDATIFSFELHSGDVQRLRFLRHGGGIVDWSPDGRQIAFITQTGLYTMNADGSNSQLVAEKNHIMPIMWHPVESKILAISSGDIENRPDNIAAIDITDGTIVQLTDTENCETLPQWSPDGRQIAFVSGNANRDIYLMDANGRNVVNLTNTPLQHEIDFSWSPDGKQIAFVRYQAISSREAHQGIYLMNADGSEQRPIMDTPDEFEFNPVWSPDGKQIAYWSKGRANQEPNTHWWTLNVMNADGSNRRILITFGPPNP